MHRTLKLLRGGEDGDPAFAPQPGLGELDDLLSALARAGVGIDLAVEGEPRPLRRASTCPPTGSSRRRSPTSSSTPAARTRR